MLNIVLLKVLQLLLGNPLDFIFAGIKSGRKLIILFIVMYFIIVYRSDQYIFTNLLMVSILRIIIYLGFFTLHYLNFLIPKRYYKSMFQDNCYHITVYI